MPIQRKPFYSGKVVRSGTRQLKLVPAKKKRLSVRQMLKRMHEPKSAVDADAQTTPGTTWVQVLAQSETIVTGDKVTQRDGNQIYASYVNIRMLLTTNNNAASNPYQGFRIVVVKPRGGATPLATDFPNGMTGDFSRDALAKFSILSDKTIYLNKYSPSIAKEVLYQNRIKLNNKMVYSSDQTARPVSGSFQIWIISDDNTYSGHFVPEARLYFRDL